MLLVQSRKVLIYHVNLSRHSHEVNPQQTSHIGHQTEYHSQCSILLLSSIFCPLPTKEPKATLLSFEGNHTAFGEKEH